MSLILLNLSHNLHLFIYMYICPGMISFFRITNYKIFDCILFMLLLLIIIFFRKIYLLFEPPHIGYPLAHNPSRCTYYISFLWFYDGLTPFLLDCCCRFSCLLLYSLLFIFVFASWPKQTLHTTCKSLN